MDTAELIWASGLFEGEGCITLRTTRSMNNPTLALRLKMTDEDSVRRFHAAIGGLGNTNGPYETGHKPNWVWQCDGFEKGQAIIAMLWNGLGLRRKARAREALLATRVDKRKFGGDASRFHRGVVKGESA